MGVTFKPPSNPKISRMRRRLPSEVDELLKEGGDLLVTLIDRNLSGKVLHFRSGRLWASWRDPKVTRTVNGHRLYLGSDVPYARIHEFGGMTGRGHRTKIPQRAYARPPFWAKVVPFITKRLSQRFAAVWT